MDIDNLSDVEVVVLINQVKNFLDHPAFSFPQIGKYKRAENVIDKINHIEYKLNIYRGSQETKYSIHLRFTENNIHLVRLCINGSNHTNTSDSTKVGKNHLHIYNANSPDLKTYAYDLKKYGNFVSTDDLVTSFEKFVKFVNIRKG